MKAFVNISSSYEEEMKPTIPLKSLSMFMALGLILAFSFSADARFQESSQQSGEVQQASQDDPITQLNLTPDQRQKIREITQESREERMRINRQLREAQFALEQTLDADSPGESMVDQRIRDVTTAQAAQIRMRALSELRIRSVLTPDQLRIWRDMRGRQRSVRRQLNKDNGGRRLMPRNFQNQRNGVAPILPRDRRGRARP